MAKKLTEKFIDITKTGAQSYRDLQNLNNIPESADKIASFADADKYFKYSGQQAIAANQIANALWEDYQELSPLYKQTGGADYFGNSIYDDDIIVGGDDFEHLSDARGRNQSWYSQLASGIVKGVGLAGTTFLDGTVGLAFGSARAILSGDISKLWDNEMSNGLHDFNQSMEEWLPNYRTEEELNRDWYQNLGTMNFWADSFLKNMGFTVGALYSGGVWTKGLKLAGKGLQFLGKGMEFASAANKAAQAATKLGSGVESLGVAMQTNGLGAKLTGSLFSAVNEGRIEANNTVSDLRDLQVQQALDAFTKRRQEIIDDATLTEDAKIMFLGELDNNYQATLNLIDDNLKKAGLTDFLLNVPILAIDNFWTFGRMYAQGFSDARNVAGKNVKKSFFGRASEAANEAADAAENTLVLNTKRNAGRYVWDEITKMQSFGKGIMTGLREGNEEMSQAWASEFAGNWSFYLDSPDTYYRAMSNPEALNNTMSSWEAASKAFVNTYGNLDRYEEFAIGALTGLLGTPTFGRSLNASANTWLGRGKMVGISGGILGEFSSDAEMNKNGYAHVTNMNAALDKRDQIDKTARIHAAMSLFNDAMNGYAESNDKFEYNNASDNLDWMGITSFISTGREEDLKTILGLDFDNISDEELEAIAAFTALNDGSNTGGFRENGSGNIITASSPQSDKNEMRQKLKKVKEKMLDEVDAYKTSVDIIRNYAAGNPNVTEEEINELAWMHWKINRFDRRASEIKKNNAEQFTLIAQTLEEFKKQQQKVLDEKEESTEGLSAAAMSVVENENAKLSKDKKNALKNLEYAETLLGIINSVASANKSVMPFLAPMLQMDKGFLEGVLKSDNFYDLAITRSLSKPEFDKAIRDIRDLGRLAEANKTFNDKLKEYIEDPLKQKKDHDKADAENEAVAQEIDKETRRKKAKKVTRQLILNGEVDADLVIKNTKTDDVERLLAQDAKITTLVKLRIESIIAQQHQEGNLSDEDAGRIESAIQQGIAQSKSINDLTGTNAAFMVDAEGLPLSDEQISLIQSLIDKATKEVAEANGLNIKDGEIDFSKIEEAIQSKTGPTDLQAKAAEEAIAKEEIKTTGNDAIEKAVAANSNGVKGNPEKAIRKGSGKSLQRGKKKANVSPNKLLSKSKKEKEAATKAAEEKARQEAIANKKNGIVSAALTYAINGNAINIGNPEDSKKIQLLSDILSNAYDLINEGKIEKLSGIMLVLKSMDEYEKLQQMLGRDPNLGSAIKMISDSLSKEFTPEEDNTDEYAELEKTIGPETVSNETVSPTLYYSLNLNPVINIPNYFAPATSQYYRDPKTGRILPAPFTTKMQAGNSVRKKKLEATYNYLTLNEAFKNASKVKPGNTIYFTIHPNLNTAAGGVVILMSTDEEGKHIVGDLADIESYTYENNALLKAMVDRITTEFNERLNKDSSEPFVSKETSTVRQSMVGHVLFTDSKNAAGDKTLNGVFGEGQFKMGVTNRSGDIITTNQGDESVSGNLKVITPKTRFTPGTPVVLIPSGEGTNKYIAVPFQMSKYDSSMRGSKFHLYAESVLKRVLLNKNGEPLDLSSNQAQVLIKNALNALFNGDFHVNFTDGLLVIHLIVNTVKDGVVNKKKVYLFRGTPNASIVNNILTAFQSNGMTIRIDRREINRDSNLKDLDFSYNTMMGDLAHTNLSDKSSTTVNDWFIINPVNEKGEEISIDRVGYRDTRTEKTPTQRNDTKITYKNNEYLVSEEGMIVDKNGNPRTDINVTDLQIILAKAEIEKNDLATPIGTEGELIYWYSLSNGNLFYNKDGEERVVVSETDKQAVKDSLTKKEDTSINALPENTEGSPRVARRLGITLEEFNTEHKQASSEQKTVPAKIGNRVAYASTKHNGISGFDVYIGEKSKGNLGYLAWDISGKNEIGSITYHENDGISALRISMGGRNDYQGYYFYRPLTLEEQTKAIDYLRKNRSNLSIDELYKGLDKLLFSSTISEPAKSTSLSQYPKGFNTQKQKDFFDAMSKERQGLLMKANPNAISSVLPYINSIINDFGIEDLDEAEDDIDNIFNMLESTKYREAEEVEKYTQADLEAEKEWLKKALPQLSDDDHFRIVNGLIKITRKNNPGYAYGKTLQGIMTISDAAATGTVYHEAFHSVIDILLNEDEINSLFIAGARKYGIERDSLNNELAIEENLAEDFRRYVQREQAYKKDLEQSSGLFKVFKVLKHTVKTWLENTSYINNMFYRINQGQMANRSLRDNRNVERYNQYTAEEKAILDKAPRDSKGRLLAPNGKPSNLTEKQYAQVRTKAFRNWFGDWENNPENASKVIDENGEPLVVYHGSAKQFNAFSIDKIGSMSGDKSGFYFTNKRKIAKDYYSKETGSMLGNLKLTFHIGNEYKSSVYDVFLNSKNPYVIKVSDKEYTTREKIIKEAKEQGYDSILFNNVIDGPTVRQDVRVVFNPNQIKSATDNVGSFSTTNNDIRYREVGSEISEITQNSTSFYRGQYDEPFIDINGNLILYGRRDSLYERAGYGKDKGVSATRNLQSAIEYGNGQLETRLNLADGSMDETELNSILENGYYLIQFLDNISNRQIKEAGEYKLIGDVIIPNGSYIIEHYVMGELEETIGSIHLDSGITNEKIQQYHKEKLDYSNLDNTQKALLEDRGISEEHYSFLTLAEKENLRRCLI